MCDVKPEQLSYERFPDIYVARSDVDTEIALPETYLDLDAGIELNLLELFVLLYHINSGV